MTEIILADDSERQAWDRYAAHAAAGILAGRDHLNPPHPSNVAKDAAELADTMVAERR